MRARSTSLIVLASCLAVAALVAGGGGGPARAGDEPGITDAPTMALPKPAALECLTRTGFTAVSQAYVDRFAKLDAKVISAFPNPLRPGIFFTCDAVGGLSGRVDLWVDPKDAELVAMIGRLPQTKADGASYFGVVVDAGAPIACSRGSRSSCYRVLALDNF